jgi:citrate lyase beta subunit
VPDILADREDAVHPNLSELARVPSDCGTLQLQHGPRGLLCLRTAGTPFLPWDLVGGAQSSVPGILADREDAVPPSLPELARVFSDWLALQVRRGPRGLLSLRTAGTPSLPWNLVGGAQSPVPDILADREDAVHPNLSELARANL